MTWNELVAADTVGVIGAGTMGAGITQVAAAAGHEVYLFDAAAGAAAKGIERIAAGLDKLVARGRIEADARGELLARIHAADEMDKLAGCALVIEAIVEDLDVKREVFARLEKICGDDTILATNTSSLSITAIAARLD